MENVKNSSFKTKITVAFFITFFLLLTVSLSMIYFKVNVVQHSQTESRINQVILNLQRTYILLSDIQIKQRRFIFMGDPELQNQIAHSRDELTPVMEDLQENISDSQSALIFGQIQRLTEEFLTKIQETIEQSDDVEDLTQLQLRSGVELRLLELIRSRINELEELEQSILVQTMAEMQRSFRLVTGLAIIGLALSIFMLFFGSIYLIRSISGPLTLLTRAAIRIGHGELDTKVELESNDEFGTLARTFNLMALELKDLMSRERRLTHLLEQTSLTSITIGTEATSQVDLDLILQMVTDRARILTNAHFAAIGTGSNPELPFERWFSSGMDSYPIDRISTPPRPVGILGLVSRRGERVRIEDLSSHPDYDELPEGLPEIGPFLAVPIKFNDSDTPLASLYLAKSPGFETFSVNDQRAIELLAQHLGVILENCRLREDLKLSIHAREDLLAVVSHDLKNPLALISMSTQHLYKENPSDRGRKLLDRITSACHRSLTLISDLLDASAIEVGRVNLNLDTHDARQSLAQVETYFAPLAEEKHIRFTVKHLTEELLIQADEGRLFQVFANLISNSIKFLPPGGKIDVTAEETQGMVRFCVHDNGPGIPFSDQGHIFERHWQLKGTKPKGSGLGLYIVKGIVTAHGGEVQIYSRPGEGALFSFTIPRALYRGVLPHRSETNLSNSPNNWP